MNKAQIVGYISREPIRKEDKNGKPFCVFAVAVKRRFGKKGDADFFNCIAFGMNATQILENYHVGKIIGLCGHIKTEMMEKNGVKFMSFFFSVEEWYALDTKRKTDIDGNYRKQDLEEAL